MQYSIPKLMNFANTKMYPKSLISANSGGECIGFSLKPKVLGVCNAPSTNGSYGYIGIGGGNLLTLPTPVVKPNTTPVVI